MENVRRCGSWWEVYDPVEDIYYMCSSKAQALDRQKKIDSKLSRKQ